MVKFSDLKIGNLYNELNWNSNPSGYVMEIVRIKDDIAYAIIVKNDANGILEKAWQPDPKKEFHYYESNVYGMLVPWHRETALCSECLKI